MNKDNNLGRVLALLSLTLLMSFGLYSLPDTLFGYKIKKVDLLSDFKVKEEKLSLDSLKQQLEHFRAASSFTKCLVTLNVGTADIFRAIAREEAVLS